MIVMHPTRNMIAASLAPPACLRTPRHRVPYHSDCMADNNSKSSFPTSVSSFPFLQEGAGEHGGPRPEGDGFAGLDPGDISAMQACVSLSL